MANGLWFLVPKGFNPEHRLMEITLSDVVIPEQSVWAVYPTTRFVPAKVRLFVDAFQAYLRAQKTR